MKRNLFIAGFLIGFAFVIAGCSPTRESGPEPTADNIVNGSATQVIRMPDGFRNVAFTCYNGNGIYVTSRGSVADTSLPSTIAVVANDPNC